MVFGSVAYILACYFGVLRLGVIGIIFANCLNMGIRGFNSLRVSKLNPLTLLLAVLTHRYYLALAGAGVLSNMILQRVASRLQI